MITSVSEVIYQTCFQMAFILDLENIVIQPANINTQYAG